MIDIDIVPIVLSIRAFFFIINLTEQMLNMSLYSDKINLIDQNTYQLYKKHNGNISSKMLHSAKYKNKHKQGYHCTLMDFLVAPRQKQKRNKQRFPYLNVARRTVFIKEKRKGKIRLYPKRRVTRLKRIIKQFRIRKYPLLGDKQSTDEQKASILPEKMQKLSLSEASKEDSPMNPLILTEINNLTINNLVPNNNESITDLNCLPQNEQQLRKPIHSRRFRSYCDNCTTASLKKLTNQLLRDLYRFQKRAHALNEIKARAHPRLIVGFRESLSKLRINKVKLLIMAPDCEVCPVSGGLDDTIVELKTICQQQNVPYCFSLMRRELAYALSKRAQVSCVAIIDYDGANEIFKQIIQELDVARTQYKCLTAT